MSVIPKLACSLNRRDEVPNQELAKEIAATNDKKAVKELFEHLNSKNKNIQSDCIKVIYEIGTVKPKLIVGFAHALITTLTHNNNRLQWGAMTALDTIVTEDPKLIYEALPTIIAAADKGSVITNDHCVGILIKLCGVKEYSKNAFYLLAERLKASPPNQLAMYAERSSPILNAQNKAAFIDILTSRLSDIEKDTQRSRIEKLIKKLNKK